MYSSLSTVVLLDVANPAHPYELADTGDLPFEPYSVAFSPDGHTMAEAMPIEVVLLNVADPAHPRSLNGVDAGNDVVNSVAFSPVGHLLATGNADGTVRLWDVTNPAHPRSLSPPLTGGSGPVNSVAFSPAGQLLASGDSDGTVQLWNLNVDYAIRRICSIAGGLTPQQWNQYIGQLRYQSICTL